jgi:hypothetical protein
MYSTKIKSKLIDKIKTKFFESLISSDRLLGKVEPLFNKEEYLGSNHTFKYMWKCKTCNVEFVDNIYSGKIPRCPNCFPKLSGVSKFKTDIIDWLKSLSLEAKQSDRIEIYPKELDIFVPSHRLAIEFDGLYWHSELQRENKNYHLEKTEVCKNKNIRLIHIFEDEWIEKREIVESIIKSKLNISDRVIYARKCSIRKISSEEAKLFLEKNHLQGYVQSKIRLGLYSSEELVSVLMFSNSRFNKNYQWEITRFASLLNAKVVGGFAKLLKHFVKENSPESIITYSDLRYFDGLVYEKNGFKKINRSAPGYFYTDYNHRFSRIEFQKHKLQKKLNVYDDRLTEWQNMQLNGYDRIWDCGNNVFVMKEEKAINV